MAFQDARLSKFEADFKQQQSKMTNKIDTFLKAINDRMTGALPNDTVKNSKLNVHPTSLVSSARSYPMCFKPTNDFLKDKPQVKNLTVNEIGTGKPKEPEKTLEDEFKDLHLSLLVLEVLAHAPIYNAIFDKYVESLELGKNRFAFIQGKMLKKMKDPKLFTLPRRLGDSRPFDTLDNLGSCVNLIQLYLFKKLKIRLLEEIDHVFGLADGTKSYPVGIVKNVEVHIGTLKILEDFFCHGYGKRPYDPFTCRKRILAISSTVIDCRKSKIAVGKGITMLIFEVKEIELGDKDVPYWTTLGKLKSYEPCPSTDGVGSRPPYYAKKDFMDYHLLEE
uniref:MAK10-like protein n=1 Tax=Tanacetum cinerariifolium TaxID=118510 RepID=A0A6L2JVW4_TANCI|nr:hypothetical protein [Tanacetum cinerariifolium]